MKAKVFNQIKLYLFTICLGAFVGAVVWLFLRLIVLCKGFVWETIPEFTPSAAQPFLMPVICASAGFLLGTIRKRYGNYPDELNVVLSKIKSDKHYDYSKMGVMMICALIPLVFGASVGPEAGLTGIIAAFCYWIGDNVKTARENTKIYSELGAAVTLGSLFRMPLFGIFEVEEAYGEDAENGQKIAFPKISKIVLYGLSAVTAFFAIKGLGALFHTDPYGFPKFDAGAVSGGDYAMIIPYILVGFLLFLIFEAAENLFGRTASLLPPVAKETICGVIIGITASVLPVILFSGEEELALISDNLGSFMPVMFIGVGILKMLMTAFCIRFGVKGGHFFPLIFACSSVGFGMSLMLFGDSLSHAVFAAAVVTASTLGAQLKKPLAASMLLMLCFPLNIIIWIVLSAIAGSLAASRIRGRMNHEGL